MIESYFIRGVLIGLLFGIPVGAVGTLTVQRTFQNGFFAGIKTGLGSSTADCLYAICGAFGLTFISDFLLEHEMIISLIGGCLILGMGVRAFLRKESGESSQKHIKGNLGMFLSSFAVGITNPAAILTFLFAFSYFGITGETGMVQGILLVMGVFVGTFFWWCFLSAGVVLLKRKTRRQSFPYMNQIFGTILAIFGVVIFVRVFI